MTHKTNYFAADVCMMLLWYNFTVNAQQVIVMLHEVKLFIFGYVKCKYIGVILMLLEFGLLTQ